MTIKTHHYAFALIFASFGACAQSAGSLDFVLSRSLAHERVDAIKVETAETRRRESEAKSVRSLHGPKIMLDAKQVWGRKTLDYGTLDTAGLLSGMLSGATQQNSPLAQQLGGIVNSLPPIDLYYEEDIGGPRAAISAELPLYTGGAISAKVAAANEAVYESRANTQAKRDAVDVELAQKYFSVQLARSVERLQEKMLAQQELELHKAKRYEKTGTISKLERMAVEVNRDAAKRELLSAQTNRRIAERELAGLLRKESLGTLTDPLFVVTKNIGTLRQWQDKALGTNPTLRAVQAQRRQAEQGVTAARSAWHPQLYAFANYNLITHYLTIPEPDRIAGIGVRFTIWVNKDRNASIAAAKSVVNKAQAAHAEASNLIMTAIETAYLKSELAREQYRLTDSTLALAQENLRLHEKGFAEGLSTAGDVNDARTKLLAAQIERRVAAYRFVVAWAMLNSIAGDMDAFVRSIADETNIFEH